MTRNSSKNSPGISWWDRARSKVRTRLGAIRRVFFAGSIGRRFRNRLPGVTRGTEGEGSDTAGSNDYAPSPAQLALWRDVAGSLTNLLEHENKEFDSHTDAILFQSAQPSHYIRHYKFKAWQRLVYPFHRASFSRRVRLLATMPGGTKSANDLIQLIDEDLAYIEFSGKPLSPQLRLRARKEMLRKRMSPWKVRTAFISTSIQCRGNQITARRVSGIVYWPFRICREAFLAFAAWSIAFAMWETARQGCLTCNSHGLMYLSVFLALFGYLAHIGGPERRQAEHFLASMKLLEFDDR